MLRRSTRLQAAGYYDVNGRPTVSYRETLYKVFKVFRRRWCPKPDMWEEGPSDSSESDTRPELKQSHFSVFFLIVPLFFAFVIFSPFLMKTKLQMETFEDTRVENVAPIFHHCYRANFALESLGAIVVSSLSSGTYKVGGWFFGSWLYRPATKPNVVIEGHSHLLPGRCWAFPGGRGHLCIAMPYNVIVSHVTLGHIAKYKSPTGSIISAPKDISVYGMKTLFDEGTKLGSFRYDEDGGEFQSFQLNDHQGKSYSFLKLQVEDNWGNQDYTCLYSFKVHGKLADEK